MRITNGRFHWTNIENELVHIEAESGIEAIEKALNSFSGESVDDIDITATRPLPDDKTKYEVEIKFTKK